MEKIKLSNAKPFITLSDVSIRLNDRVLFQGLFWEMWSDQHWAVLGPNGSGKSSLMRALCGDLPIVKGNITYQFVQVNGHLAPQDYVAYVTFEAQRRVLGDESYYQERWNTGMSEDSLSVSEFLSEQSVKRLNRFHVVESHPDEGFAALRQDAIERLDIGKLLGRQVVQLSNGERRKVNIARALLKSPRLLILDNPFGGLDERFRVRLAENLENLMEGEMRVMVVGTGQEEVPPGITHILRINEDGTVSQSPRCHWEPHRGGAIPSIDPHIHIGDRVTQAAHDRRHSELELCKTLVQMQNVNVSYNGTPVLHQVNWTVRENEQWALLGPNGAGKTTLLSLILADNPQAYANDITLFGKRRGTGESIWEIKRNIGWVSPELQLYYPRNATCLDVVCSGWFDSVGLYRETSPEQQATALAWLNRFGLAARGGTMFDQLSEGEQRLALLARALVKSPALLVLDEPCQGLDGSNRDRVLQAIDAVNRQSGTSMIYVTHRADELPRSITHVLRLNEGRVVDQKTS